MNEKQQSVLQSPEAGVKPERRNRVQQKKPQAIRGRQPGAHRGKAHIRLLIDGVSFQLAEFGIGQGWASVLPSLIAKPDLDVLVLDRGGLPNIAGLKRIPFPTYTMNRYNADDSKLIQKVCDHYEVDVFTSTYYTTPLITPMFLFIHDMIPELSELPIGQRQLKEKAIAISYARRHISVSEHANDDLLRFYPELSNTTVACLAYDKSVFKQADDNEVMEFRRSISFAGRPYLVVVRSPEQTRRYNNGRQLFEAIAAAKREDFDILCIGGGPFVGDVILDSLPADVQVKRIEVTDTELAKAYSGAFALIHLEPYEGFGLPVLEAMACGCPVITTSRGSLAEVAGDAAIIVDSTSPAEILTALDNLQPAPERLRVQRAGLEQARKFDGSMITAIIDATRALADTGKDPSYCKFTKAWSTLRQMQSEVDVERF